MFGMEGSVKITDEDFKREIKYMCKLTKNMDVSLLITMVILVTGLLLTRI